MHHTRIFAIGSLSLASVLVITACGGAPNEEAAISQEAALACAASTSAASVTAASATLPTGESVRMTPGANGAFTVAMTAPGASPIKTTIAPKDIPAYKYEAIGNEAFIVLTTNGTVTRVGLRDVRYDAATDTLTMSAAYPDGRVAPLALAGYGLQDAFGRSTPPGGLRVQAAQAVGIIAACAASGLAFAVCLAIVALVAFLAWICLRAIQTACAACAAAGLGCDGAISWEGCHGKCIPVTGSCTVPKGEPAPIPE